MQQVKQPRVDSPERWEKALQRAMDANLAYMELIAGDGAWAVSSQRDTERGYIATTQTCTCEPGRSGDPICAHRALVRVLVGMFPLPELEDAATSAEPCRYCRGRGKIWSEHYGELRPCDACQST